MGLESRTSARAVKIAAFAMWVASLALMIYGTGVDPAHAVAIRAWALWVQMCAWGCTAWWMVSHIARRERLRVSDLADIMARVAADESEQKPKHSRVSRIY